MLRVLLSGLALVLGCVLGASVTVDWTKTIAVSRSLATLQVVANPVLNPKTSPIAARAFENLANLDADLIRYVPWFPYPSVGVAELEPPNAQTRTTSWDFSNILPQLDAVLNATVRRGKRLVPNFSTQPTWMYDTKTWDYPSDPNKVDWGYPRGNANANTTELLSGYYSRLLSWLSKGYLDDEFGNRVGGGPAFPLTHWEVFNEPQGCHGLDVQGYTQQYDAIVARIQRDVGPNIRFVGLALEQEGDNLEWMRYFLNHSNHAPNTPLDLVSFHFYAQPSSRTDLAAYETVFPQADGFLATMKQMADARNTLSPRTQLSCDEMGVILPNDNTPGAVVPPPIYWVAAAGYFAYMFSKSAVIGIEILGESQYAGCPAIPAWDIADAQYPSVSMINWTTGEGNARYWLLKLLIEHTSIGDVYVDTTISSDLAPLVHAQAFVGAKDDRRRMLVINKKSTPVDLQIAGASGATAYVIDESSGEGPAPAHTLPADKMHLDAFGIAILVFV